MCADRQAHKTREPECSFGTLPRGPPFPLANLRTLTVSLFKISPHQAHGTSAYVLTFPPRNSHDLVEWCPERYFQPKYSKQYNSDSHQFRFGEGYLPSTPNAIASGKNIYSKKILSLPPSLSSFIIISQATYVTCLEAIEN